jgi:hypothetical protein
MDGEQPLRHAGWWCARRAIASKKGIAYLSNRLGEIEQ